ARALAGDSFLRAPRASYERALLSVRHTSARAQNLLDRLFSLVLGFRCKALETQRPEVASLEDLERVNHPDRSGGDRESDTQVDQGVRQIPVAVRPRRDEPHEDRVGGQERCPKMTVGHRPSL